MKAKQLLRSFVVVVFGGATLLLAFQNCSGFHAASIDGASLGVSSAVSANLSSGNDLENGIVMGYQGWFAAAGDGSGLGFPFHWAREWNIPTLQTNNLNFEMWPDLSEFSSSELYPTGMKLGNRQDAFIYSAANPATVNRHFRWMKDYGIGGIALQRFLGTVQNDDAFRAFADSVLQNVMAAASAHGRKFFVEYDLSGVPAEQIVSAIQQDWTRINDRFHLSDSAFVMKQNGKPLVGVFGLGFTGRGLTPDLGAQVVGFFKGQGLAVFGGVPFYWRSLNNDSESNAGWRDVYHSLDVISPWSVGRFTDANSLEGLMNQIDADLADTQPRGILYLPVIWPGYSANREMNAAGFTLNQIPRKGGRFWWHQLSRLRTAGVTSFFGAMFDEMDEGTAMFKLAPTLETMPLAENMLPLNIDGESLPSDWYLQLVGAAQIRLSTGNPIPDAIPIGVGTVASLTPQIQQAYQDILGHAPDASGLQFYLMQMENGASVADVRRALATSTEAVDIITSAFRARLQRAPTAGELQSYQESLISGRMTLAQAQSAIAVLPLPTASSPNSGSGSSGSSSGSGGTATVDTTAITNFVTHLYQAFFSREPDAAGLAYWVAQYNQSAVGCQALAKSFLTSTEDATRVQFMGNAAMADTYLKTLYRALYWRAPDSAGFDYWRGQLLLRASISPSLLAVEDAFLNSQEFKDVCSAKGIRF